MDTRDTSTFLRTLKRLYNKYLRSSNVEEEVSNQQQINQTLKEESDK